MKKIGFGLIGNLPIRTTIELVQKAENYGFESFWMHETYFYRDAISYLASLVPSTNRIKLATGCINPFTRHPVLIAMTMSALDEMSNGRMILGLGTGYLARLDQMGIPHANPVRHLEESISIIRRLLAGETTTYQGRQYALKDLKPFFPQVDRGISIYMAAWKKRMIELAARVADGYLARPTESLQSLAVLSQNLKVACKKHDRDPSRLEMAAYLLCSVKKSDEAAREAVRQNPFTIYQFAVIDDYVLTQSGFDPAIKKQIAERYWKGDLSGASKEISDELIDAFTLAGTSENVIGKIEAFSRIAMPVLQPVGAGLGDANAILEIGRTFVQE